VNSFGKWPTKSDIPLTKAYDPANDVLRTATSTYIKQERIPHAAAHATIITQKSACDCAYLMNALFSTNPTTAPPAHASRNTPNLLNFATTYPTHIPIISESARITHATHCLAFCEIMNWYISIINAAAVVSIPAKNNEIMSILYPKKARKNPTAISTIANIVELFSKNSQIILKLTIAQPILELMTVLSSHV
jgi:hypothetical protein